MKKMAILLTLILSLGVLFLGNSEPSAHGATNSETINPAYKNDLATALGAATILKQDRAGLKSSQQTALRICKTNAESKACSDSKAQLKEVQSKLIQDQQKATQVRDKLKGDLAKK